jgi:alpha-mannosidase
MPKRKPKDVNRSPDLPHNWVERHIERLQQYAFYDPLVLDHWQYKRTHMVEAGCYQDIDTDWQTICLGDKWGGTEVTALIYKTITIPPSHVGNNVYLDLDLDGGETQLSINGQMWQGLDRFRNLVHIGELALSGAKLELQLEAFTINYPYDARFNDQRDYHQFRRAQLLCRDEIIDDCLSDFRAVFDAYMHYWRSDSNMEIEAFLLLYLEQACRLIGPGFTSRTQARESAISASKLLRENVLNSEYFRRQGEISIYAHSHLDIVYLWPMKETFRKNGRTVSNMLNLMREYPDYIYSQSQPYLYEQLHNHYPALFDEVKERINEGRWDVVGAMYVEPDGNLLGAESWVRQIMFGKRILREKLNVDSKVCWLPDVFGVLHTLPQILKKSGIDYFLTAKLNIWNDTNNFPHDSFRWRGPDGSEVIAHFPATHFAQDFNYTNLQNHWSDYREKQESAENLFVYGWGDGGGGPTREMIEQSRRVERFPNLPRVKTTLAEPFFERLQQKQSALPVWDDELYMEGHRGTYTSKGDLKRNNRKSELFYRDIEMISVMTMEFSGPFIQPELNKGWELILLNQFHDTLPGSHVPEAMPDIERDYTAAFAMGQKVLQRVITFMESNLEQPADLLLFNTLDKRDALISVDAIENNMGIKLSSGEDLVVQQDQGKLFFQTQMPAYGWQTASYTMTANELTKADSSGTISKIKQAAKTGKFDGNHLETDFYRFIFNQQGNLEEIYDKQYDRQILSGQGNQFQVFEDDPGKSFGAWDIAYHFEEYQYPVTQIQAWTLVANGPHFARLSSKWKVLNSVIDQDMIVYANQRRIDFNTQVDWQDSKKLLKVAFPLCIRSRQVTYDLPFGNIERETHRNTGWQQAKFEVCGHKWADMSEGDYGVALMNDCKYGYDAITFIVSTEPSKTITQK